MFELQAIIVVSCIILSNIGARYIMIDMHRRHEKLFSHPNMRYVYIFCMAYLGSRDPYLSFVAAFMYGLL